MSLEAPAQPGMDEMPDQMNGLREMSEAEAEAPRWSEPSELASFRDSLDRAVEAEASSAFEDVVGRLDKMKSDLAEEGKDVKSAEVEISAAWEIDRTGKVINPKADGKIIDLEVIDLAHQEPEEEDQEMTAADTGVDQDGQDEIDDFALWEAELSEDAKSEIDAAEREAVAETVAEEIVAAEIGKLVVSGELSADEQALAEDMLASDEVKKAVTDYQTDDAEVVEVDSRRTDPEVEQATEAAELAELEAQLKADLALHIMETAHAEMSDQVEKPEKDPEEELSHAAIGAMEYVAAAELKVEAEDPDAQVDAVLRATAEAASLLAQYEQSEATVQQLMRYAVERIKQIAIQAEELAIQAEQEAVEAGAKAETSRNMASVGFTTAA